MRMSLGQHLRQVQKQVLAPRMIQSMEILQLPILALEERVQQELVENPVLEIREEVDEESFEPAEEVEPPLPISEDEKALVIDEEHGLAEDFERLVRMEELYPEHFEEQFRPSRNRIEEEIERYHDLLANQEDHPETLRDYLMHQLGYFEVPPEVRAMAEKIIYNLDRNGYLPMPLQDLLGPGASPEDLAVAEEGLRIVQQMDPPGVGARDLKECLLLQLQPGMTYYEELREIISKYLKELENNRLPVIAKKMGIPLSKVQEVVKELRKLNPRPGANFDSEKPLPVRPDIFVEKAEDGTYRVRLEEGRVPSLYISPFYRQLLAAGKLSGEAKEYLKRKLNSAQWLIDSIRQRRTTLTKIAQAIIDHQKEFLEKGPSHIEPLKMQQIAEKVGVDVSTVSRAVDGKWVQTPSGIFPLRRFFCGGTQADDGDQVAWDAIRVKLKEIIDNEDKSSPLSDEEIVAELAKQGIHVARRTVTKYRKAMKIPSSRQRRQWVASDSASNNSTK
jgi:RNA polymerase sigma-54 factor